MVKTAKELLRKEILSLDKKAKLYKELYDENPLAGVDKEEEAFGKKEEEQEAFEKKPQVTEEKSDMDKIVDVVESLKNRLEALENPSANNQVIKKEEAKPDEIKKEETDESKSKRWNDASPVRDFIKSKTQGEAVEEEPKKEEGIAAYMPGAPTKGSAVEIQPDNTKKEVTTFEKQPDNISKEAQEAPKTEEPKVEEFPKKEEPAKEATPVEGEVKKETEDGDEDDPEKKPIPPVMEKLRLKNIRIESSFKPTKSKLF